MCELFGVTSDHRIKLNSFLKVLGEHSNQHPHGWGYASVTKGQSFQLKEPKKAADSAIFSAMLQTGILSSMAIAHIRYATVGDVQYTNCHPFSERTKKGRMITLAHNGTLLRGSRLSQWSAVQAGDTDSERILLQLIHAIDTREMALNRELTSEERFHLFDREICSLAEGNKLNLLFSDEEYIYAHTNCRETLYYLKKDGSYIIATSPLSDEPWSPFPFTQLIAFRDGSIAFQGTIHHHEYIFNKDDFKDLYLIFANL